MVRGNKMNFLIKSLENLEKFSDYTSQKFVPQDIGQKKPCGTSCIPQPTYYTASSFFILNFRKSMIPYDVQENLMLPLPSVFPAHQIASFHLLKA